MVKRYRAVCRLIDAEPVADMVETPTDGYVLATDYDALAARLAEAERDKLTMLGVLEKDAEERLALRESLHRIANMLDSRGNAIEMHREELRGIARTALRTTDSAVQETDAHG